MVEPKTYPGELPEQTIALEDEQVLRAACQVTSINWTLSGEQVYRLYKQVQAVKEELGK